MQQTNKNIKILKFISSIIFLIFYQIISSSNQFIPTGLAVVFVTCVAMAYKKKRTYQDLDTMWYLLVLYMIFVSGVHGFELFSALIAFVIFYNFMFDWLLSVIKIKSILIFLIVLYSYIASFLISNSISYFQDKQYMQLSYEYILFIAIEFFISFVFFKDKFIS